MRECYDPNGPRYCNIHKRMSDSSKTGLESMLAELTNKSNKGYINK